ncbi:transcriptional regulator domain-containing protein, partial [Xanthobacter flavus]
MKPDTSRWREDASYVYFDTLSVEGLAWECLRRDETYQEHYQSLV